MTGEITLRGQVLPIGGIKEKALAAHRFGLDTVIMPKRNEKDLEDIPEQVRNEMTFVLVDRVDQVLETALGDPISPAHDNGNEPELVGGQPAYQTADDKETASAQGNDS